MIHETEPCAALPKTQVTVLLTWCEHHQTWTLSHHVYRVLGDTITDVAPYTVEHFGPFDNWLDVQSAAVRATADGMYATARGSI